MEMPERPSKSIVGHTGRLGLTLLELVISVVIIGILATVVVLHTVDRAPSAQAAAELHNARLVLRAVRLYATENGSLPRDGSTGTFPSDLSGYLEPKVFTERTPTDGLYDWNGPPPWASLPTLNLVLPPGEPAATRKFYLEMEATADDGSPTSGWIRASANVIHFRYSGD